MVPNRLLHIRHGVNRSLVKPSSIFHTNKIVSIPIRLGQRNLSVLEPALLSSKAENKSLAPVPTPVALSPPTTENSILEEEEDDLKMSAQQEAELLTMQHILGLKDASDKFAKTKPQDLSRLECLKAAEPVFVCVDLEAYELDHEKITEVGISILDSRDVVGTDPGTNAAEWLSRIKTRHIIIEEHKHLVNKRFVHGCPDRFNFGKSEMVSLTQIKELLTQIFQKPSDGELKPSDQGRRKLILVGHGLSNDTAFLRKIDFAPHVAANIIQDIDTQKFVGHKKQGLGLSKLLIGLGVDAKNLHNAGNDAAYTMQALILMTFQHTNDPGAFWAAVRNVKRKVDPVKQQRKERRAELGAERKSSLKQSQTQATTAPEQDHKPSTAADPISQPVSKTSLETFITESSDRLTVSESTVNNLDNKPQTLERSSNSQEVASIIRYVGTTVIEKEEEEVVDDDDEQFPLDDNNQVINPPLRVRSLFFPAEKAACEAKYSREQTEGQAGLHNEPTEPEAANPRRSPRKPKLPSADLFRSQLQKRKTPGTESVAEDKKAKPEKMKRTTPNRSVVHRSDDEELDDFSISPF